MLLSIKIKVKKSWGTCSFYSIAVSCVKPHFCHELSIGNDVFKTPTALISHNTDTLQDVYITDDFFPADSKTFANF